VFSSGGAKVMPFFMFKNDGDCIEKVGEMLEMLVLKPGALVMPKADPAGEWGSLRRLPVRRRL